MAKQAQRDPREAGPKPPFPRQEQDPVGLESEMEPRPDYGYDSYEGRGRLRDRVALITGGDSGIGRAVALAYAREGADVLISYLDEHSDAEETTRVVEEAGRKGIAIPGDIGDREHCRELVGRAVEELGRLDILVNNAAYQATHDSITEIPPDELERVFRTNVLAQFYLCQEAIPHLGAGSAIINRRRSRRTSRRRSSSTMRSPRALSGPSRRRFRNSSSSRGSVSTASRRARSGRR